MEKKFKFSDSSAVSKIVYLTVVAILCVSAIVIGVVAANSRKKTDVEQPPVTDNTDGENGNTDNSGNGGNGNTNTDNGNSTPAPEVKPTFVSPVVGTVIKSHSTTVPVFSETLDEWRIHTGLDISTGEGAEVYASSAGEVTGIYTDPMLGKTVEITHSENHKSYYSNLSADGIKVAVGDKVEGGTLLGTVGDTSVSEIADETHLHFELKVNGASVNPLDYFTEESKKASLGIE